MSDVVTYRPYGLKFLGEDVPKSLLLVTRHIPFPGKDGVMSGGSSRRYPLEPRERATLNAGDQPPAEMRYQKVSNLGKVRKHIDQCWGDEIVPTLAEYIKIPNKSPAFVEACTSLLPHKARRRSS